MSRVFFFPIRDLYLFRFNEETCGELCAVGGISPELAWAGT